MRQKKIVHVLAPDKFAIPFITFINKEFNCNEHLFLCSTKPDESLLSSNNNVRFLHSPYRKNIIKNTIIFYRSIREASKIILHGNPVLFYFILWPGAIKKICWVIYGYELGYSTLPGDEEKLNLVESLIKKFVLKRVHGHISHIKGDSELANIKFKSSAKFYYSPMYLSNVLSEYKQGEAKTICKSKVRKIMVGNSTSPTNDHASIFKMLLPYKEDNILIYCPLSYGKYQEYRDGIIKMGIELFGEKFVPMTHFMKLEEYNTFIGEIDIAIFNHKRQEAMGVILTLLNMAKIVYINSQVTSYNSLIDRGIKVFDNKLINKDGLYFKRDISMNPALVYKEYSYEKLKRTLSIIFND
jgi:dTDP-N-acetylfucosamine:lipid II N-acetylfucosaminyltransferase